jgi:eukaryotic-like serine/threonine-protein kinase
MSELMEPQPRQIKGHYTLGPCIRMGGMGAVFAGWTKGADGGSQRVAIKQILPDHSRDPHFRALFVNEARLSSCLQHRNIVRVFDFDEDETGSLFLVMEYVDGVELDVLMRTGRLPLPLVLFLVAEILQGLSYLHDLPAGEGRPLGIVHRDVSPHNVLLSWEGAVQLSDFGIAKARCATLAGPSGPETSRGKGGYMSPEQAGGLPLDGRSDVYSAGVMLWEMLSGEHLPRDVETVIMRMLQRRREDRIHAAVALDALTGCADFPMSGHEALAELLRERFPRLAPHRGRPAPTEEKREPPVPVPLSSLRSIAQRMRRRNRRKPLLVAITGGALVAITGGALTSAPWGYGFLDIAEVEAPALELPVTSEPPARPTVRLVASEREPTETTSQAPSPVSSAVRATSAGSPTPLAPGGEDSASPPAPARRGMRIIEFSPEGPEQIQSPSSLSAESTAPNGRGMLIIDVPGEGAGHR